MVHIILINQKESQPLSTERQRMQQRSELNIACVGTKNNRLEYFRTGFDVRSTYVITIILHNYPSITKFY